MKKSAISLVLMMVCVIALAQVPESFNYQVVVRDGVSNNPLVNQDVAFQMSILKGNSSGISQYSELHSANTGDLGIVNLVIGNGTSKFGDITTIDWGADIYFLKVEIDKTGGTSYVDMGTTQLLSVPYALNAKTAENYTETDPVFTAHPANGILGADITNWNTAFSWGNHATIGYLTSYTETDPKIGTNTADYISKWDGSKLISSAIFDNGKVGIGTTEPSAILDIRQGNLTNVLLNITNGNVAGPNASTLMSFKGINATENVTLDISTANIASPLQYIGLEAGGTQADRLILQPNGGDVGIGTYETSSKLHVNGVITATGGNSTNWNTAYGWGNHVGLYRLITYVPSWTEITAKPTTLTGFGITDAVNTTGDQNIAGNKTFSGTTTVITPVNATDAATKAYVDELKTQIEELQFAAGIKIKDIDGNVYKGVTIGTQVWMAENLKTTKYNDGTPIPNITDNTAWAALTTGAYSDYNNTPSNSTTYGRLYNWYAVDNNAATKVASNGGKNVCPTGWHIPSDIEWTTLTDYLTNNGYGYEGSGVDIAKSMAATSGWTSFGTPGTVGNDQASNNSSGFTALPGGYRYFNGTFGLIGNYGYWWSATESGASSAWGRNLTYNNVGVSSYGSYEKYGFSVRCVRD